jgi:hypothetical protein
MRPSYGRRDSRVLNTHADGAVARRSYTRSASRQSAIPVLLRSGSEGEDSAGAAGRSRTGGVTCVSYAPGRSSPECAACGPRLGSRSPDRRPRLQCAPRTSRAPPRARSHSRRMPRQTPQPAPRFARLRPAPRSSATGTAVKASRSQPDRTPTHRARKGMDRRPSKRPDATESAPDVHKHRVRRQGLEPRTRGLRVRCSAS